MFYCEKCPILNRYDETVRKLKKVGDGMTQVTNETILLAISELSGYVKNLTIDMLEVKKDISGMKEDISGMKEDIFGINKRYF